MTQQLNRITAALLIGFLMVGFALGFWSVIRAPSLLARDDNARNVIAEQAIRRGAILDRDGELLAYSVADESGIMQRVYPQPEAASAVGYYSFTYGTAGIEKAYNSELRGDAWLTEWESLVDEALHRTLTGGDVRATVDRDVQEAAAAALGDHSGAVVVVEVPSGSVLAMVSQPGFDPNKLDQNWDALTKAETSPLLNRVTAGLYQPGGTLETVILAAILSAYADLPNSGAAVLNAVVPDARDPVHVNGLTLTCLAGTPERDLTLAEAYVYGCPAAFANALDETPNGSLTPERVWERFMAFGLLDVPELAGFDTAIAENLPDPFTAQTPADTLRAALVGQGDLTVTPLQMVQIAAAIANRGNAVPLHLVDAIRPPDADDNPNAWQPVPTPALEPALMRTDVAAALRLAMLEAAAQSPHVSDARRGNLVLYGHTALSFAGPPLTPYAWFVGFVDQTVGSDVAAIAAVVVIEDEADPGEAAQVAGAAFAAAGSD
jgi:peptidoglycan glycosyltransferase